MAQAPQIMGGQGSAGSTDLATQLAAIVRNLSNNYTALQNLIVAVQHGSVSGYTVANLPSTPAIGTLAYVTDGASSIAWGSTVTSGGSSRYLVWWNGTAWTVIGK